MVAVKETNRWLGTALFGKEAGSNFIVKKKIKWVVIIGWNGKELEGQEKITVSEAAKKGKQMEKF